MGKTLHEMKIEEECLKNALQRQEDVHQCAISALAKLRADLDRVRNEMAQYREVSEKDAPNSGKHWSNFEREQLEDKLQDFLFETAKKTGRSTLAIRHKVLEEIVPKIPYTDVKRINQEARR